MRSSALTNRGVRCKSRSVPAFDCLGDPVRRRILGPCIHGDGAAGEVGAVAQEEFEISRSRVPRELLEVHAGTGDPVLASGLMVCSIAGSVKRPCRGRRCGVTEQDAGCGAD
jgi:hypothetical protein